jgi:ABC transport system ATP-binding/permease protein
MEEDMASEPSRLIIKTGPNPGKAFDLTKEVMSIGREASNDIAIPDTEISRNHARISRKGGAYVLEDLGSTNGTFVNKQRLIAPRALVPGDVIGLGTNVVVTLEGPGAGATAVASTAYQPAGARQATPPPASPAPVYITQNAPASSGGGPGKMMMGCVVVGIILCVVAVGGLFIFDYMNLYCTAPFDAIFGSLGYCVVP